MISVVVDFVVVAVSNTASVVNAESDSVPAIYIVYRVMTAICMYTCKEH